MVPIQRLCAFGQNSCCKSIDREEIKLLSIIIKKEAFTTGPMIKTTLCFLVL